MKKLFLLLLAAVMVFSLAACSGNGNNGGNGGAVATPAEGYDAEFTVYIGYGDEWTPFPGKSGVTFANSDNSVLAVKDNGTKVEFTGLIAGDSLITATLDGTESKALVHVRAVEGVTEKINYIYNPPTDNFFIRYTVDEQEGLNARIGNIFLYGESGSGSSGDEGMLTRVDLSGGGAWLNSYEITYEWQEDDNYYPENYVNWNRIDPLDAMEEYFVKYLRTSGFDGDALSTRLTEFYVGKERVLGIDCWVFDTQGYNALELKFWIDPSNGCCLKSEKTETGTVTTVTECNLNYTQWDGKLKP
jgi:uncharacterized lipoprotein YehR (DUF1307 family)